MKQLTLRVPDDLVDDLKRCAASREQSVNGVAIHLFRSLLDPEYEESDAEIVRAKLRRAGLLAELSEKLRRPPPSREDFERARQAAGRGKPLSDYVIEDRN